jgi:N-methylhydantoinase A/oxoprolinase/acetone carboxylase beta subunit
MVEAVDVHTVGLGGDSQVRLDAEGHLTIGPRRVVPLCMLASQCPEVVDDLRGHAGTRQQHLVGQFVMAYRYAAPGLSDEDERLLHELAAGPRSMHVLVDQLRYGPLVMRRVESLEARRLVVRSGFTPTDALHALGRLALWEAEASRLGAGLLAGHMNLSPEAFCERVVAGMSNRVTTEVVSKALADEGVPVEWESEPAASALLARALGGAPESDLGSELTLRRPVIAIGAPAEAYLPPVAHQLHTQVIVAPHAGVANAIGAAIGGVVQQLRVEIRPLNAGQHFRLHLPDGVHDFPSLEEGVAYAHHAMLPHLETLAYQAGTDQVEVQMARVDHTAPVAAGWGQQLYLGTELVFTAVGRPSPVRER